MIQKRVDKKRLHMRASIFLLTLAALAGPSVFAQTAPVVSDIPDQTIDEGAVFTTISLDDYVTDAESTDDLISWSYSGNTDLTVSIDANRIATITIPSTDWFGSETITFTATDPDLLTDNDAATFTVTNLNDAPIVSDIPNQTIDEGSTFTTIALDDFVSDIDNVDSEIGWTYSGNTELTVSIVSRVATITIPSTDWFGSETITFTATDPGLLTDNDAATFTVTNINDAPVVSDIPNQTINEGSTFATISLDDYVSDIDNIDSDISWTYSGNTNLTVSIVSRVATITIPGTDWFGSETITFTATDPGLLSDGDPAIFTVTNINDAPVVSDIPNQTVAEGTVFATINLDDFVADIDNSDGEISWSYSGQSNLTVSINGSRVATITPVNPNWNGTETITFTATDPGLLFDTDDATFTVTAVNDAPVVAGIPDQTIAEGSTFVTINLDDYVTDVDNTDAEMIWTKSGNSQLLVDITNRVATIIIPGTDWYGSETITFRATDPSLLIGEDAATFTVTNVNDAPVVSDIPDQTVAEGASFVTINLDNYVSDIDNADAEMTWTTGGATALSVNIDINRVATVIIPDPDWNGSETITFTATDPGLLTGSNPATFTVTAVNDAPVVSDIPDQTVDEGQAFLAINLDDYVTDIDNADGTIAWTYSGNISLTVNIDASRVATVTAPNADWNGSETITFTATDPGLLTDNDAATFTIDAVNDAPVVSDIPGQTIDEGSTFTTIDLNNYVTDIDNSDAEMTWTYSGNTSLTVSIDASRIATITISNADWNGSETITFTATDPGLLSDGDPATFTVNNINDVPVVADIPNQSVAEGAAFATINLDNYVTDIDNTVGEMTWTYSGDVNFTVSIVDRIATITPVDPDWNGSETITFTTTDPGLLSDSDDATFTVTAVNDAPVVAGIPDQAIPEGSTFATINLDNYVTDIDNTDAEMTWTKSGNVELLVDITNRVATIVVPSAQWSGSETITFTATDPGLLSGSDAATFTVSANNDAPVVTAIPNQTISEGGTFTTITLDNYVSDADNSDAEMTWTTSGETDLIVSIDGSRVATVTIPSADWYGTETITFRATDPGLLFDETSVVFTVTNINDAPVVADIPNQTIAEGATFITISLDNYVADIDNADNQISWTTSGESELAVSINVSRVATIVIPNTNWNGSETITFTATDPGLLSDADAATFTVTAVNDAPVVTGIPDQTIAEGANFATINLDSYASDADHLDSELSWTYSGNTELTVSIDASRVATITIPSTDWNGAETITFTATDPDLAFDSDDAVFTVTAVNDAPVVTDIPDQTINEGDAFATINLNDFVSDIDNADAQISWSYSGNVSLVVNINASHVATITAPNADWNGSESITFRATDPGLLFDDDAATFTINAVNDAPVVLDIPNQSIAEGSAFTLINLDDYITDVDNLDNQMSWTYSGATDLIINITNRVATITVPSTDWYGSETITFTATDPGLLSDGDPATFTVTNINDAPVVADIPDQTITEGGSFATINLDDYVSDIDNLDAELSWTYSGNVELSVSINASRVATITAPASDWNGSETITFRATDPGLLFDEDGASFIISADNDAPVVSDIPNQTIAEGASFATINLDDYVTDIDNADDAITWTYSGAVELSVAINARVATITIPNPDWNGTETITFTATDPGLLSDSDPATFTVTAVNDAPVVLDIPNQTIPEGSNFTQINLDNYVTDVDNTASQMIWTKSGNVQLLVDISNRIATIVIPGTEWSGSETITFRATDPGSLFDEDVAVFTVTAVNDAPVVTNIPDQTIAEGATFTTISLDSYVSDLDNTDAEMTWTASGETNLIITIDASRVATISIPSADWFGAETITFRATDPGTLYDEDAATFTVTNVNDAPVVADIPDQTIAEGASFITINLDDYVTDIDNTDSQIGWTTSGATDLSVSINASRVATISIPNINWNGSETITFTATDPGLLSDADAATFTVTAVNDAPVVADIPNQSIAEGGSYATINLDNYVSDVDNADAEISWSYSGNTELTVSIDGSRVATITTPSPTWNGSETITFTATDPGLLSDFDDAVFSVSSVNDPPVVSDIPSQTIDEGGTFATINLDDFVADLDHADNQITWSYSGNTDLNVSIDNRVATITTPNVDWNGAETITFTATDPGLLANSNAATFTVNPINDAPVVADIPDQTIAEGTTFLTINLDNFVNDIDNADSEIDWAASGQTDLTITINASRVATVAIPFADWNGAETISFTATDPGLLTDADPATFTVTAVNDAPVVVDIPDQTIAEGSTFATISLDDYVSDIDNSDAELTWTYSGNSQLTVSIDAAHVATITTPTADWNGAETITFTATDPGLLSDSDNATFTISGDNDAPVVSDIPDQTIAEGATFVTINLDDYVSDIDNTDAQMNWTYSGNTALTVSISTGRIATISIPDVNWNGAETITFTATDPGLLSDSDPATFTVTAVNDAPVVSNITNQTISEGGSFSVINLDDYVSDIDNIDSDIDWTYSGNVDLTVSIDGNRVATIGIPSADWNGMETITFTATDPGLLTDSDDAVFTVNAVNDAPVVADIPGQTIAEGGTFTTINLDDYVNDIDNIDSDISWTYSGNSQLIVSIDANRVATISTPNADWNGAETITFRATDPSFLFDTDPATFTATAVNDAPAVADIPDQTIDEGSSFVLINLDDFVTDIDNADNQMTWTFSGNSELIVNIVSRVATIAIPNTNWFGSETVTFTATDPGLLFDTDPATFTATAVNDAPVVTNIPDQAIGEGASFATINLDDYVSDVDNSDAEMSWTYSGNVELSVSIDVNRVATITIPAPDWNGSEIITFTATDPGLLSDSDPATFVVSADNDAPVVTDIPNQTIAEGATFITINLDDFVSDIDNTDAQMTWTATGQSDLTINIDGARVATISIPDINWNGAETITFRATDPGLLFDEDAATFTVTAVNDAPVLAAIGSQSVAEGGNLSFTVTASDIDADVLTMTADDLPANATYDDNLNGTGSFNFDPDYTQEGVYDVTFIVFDGALADSEIVQITVTGTNRVPVADAGPDQIGIVLGNIVTLDGTGSSDPENDPLNYNWVQVSGPAVTLSDPTIAQPTFDPTSPGNYEFELTVDDNILFSVPDMVIINVINRDAPEAITDLQINISGDDIVLNWSAVTTDIGGFATDIGRYVIYRNTTTYFTPTDFDSIGYTDDAILTFTDNDLGGANVVGDTINQYFYTVVAVDIYDNKSAVSNRVGEYDYQIVITPTTDFNLICVPFENTGITNAVGLINAIGSANVNTVNNYQPLSQSFESRFAAGFGVNFAVVPGGVYQVNAKAQTVFSVAGNVPAPGTISYNLVTTSTTDYSFIVIPFDMAGDFAVAQDVLNHLPGSFNTLNRFIANSQSYESRFAAGFGSNFAVKAGKPYQANAAAAAVFPGP